MPVERLAGPATTAMRATIAAHVTIAESQLGLWHWPGLTPNLFMQSTVAFSSAR